MQPERNMPDDATVAILGKRLQLLERTACTLHQALAATNVEIAAVKARIEIFEAKHRTLECANTDTSH